MTNEQIGAIAGLGASLGWLFTSIFFTAAGRRIGPTAVNGLRLVFAVAFLSAMHMIVYGTFWPTGLPAQFVYLALSGLIGLVIGDQLLYTAFIDIGPRLTLLLLTTTPIFAAFLGLVFLSESLGIVEILAVIITLAGVAWVISERKGTSADRAVHPHVVRGVLFALFAAACQAIGAWLSKQGMGHGVTSTDEYMDPLSATTVRMAFALVLIIPLMLIHVRRKRRQWREGDAKARTHEGTLAGGIGFTLLGAICGPFLGVWASLIAYDRAPLGVAQTMCGLSPVLILPLIPIIYRERLTWRAIIGAIVAVAGTALLFLDGQIARLFA